MSIYVVLVAGCTPTSVTIAGHDMRRTTDPTAEDQVYTLDGRIITGNSETINTLPPWSLNDPWMYRGYQDDPREDFKLDIQPNWLKEQRMTPRKPKRVPSNTPGPGYSYRRGAY
jgi:hypothetical protein